MQSPAPKICGPRGLRAQIRRSDLLIHLSLQFGEIQRFVLVHGDDDSRGNDAAWALIEPYTIGNKGSWGGNARDTRLFINAIFWILRTGAPWRDLPPEYGDWKNTHRRFYRRRDKQIWERILEALIDEPDFEWLMIDASHIKVHPHATGAVGGNQDMERTKGGSTPRTIWPWMRMVCQYGSLLQRVPQRIAQLQRN